MAITRTAGIAVAFVAVLGVSFGIASHRVKKTTVNGSDWFASLTDAQVEAKKTGKPILLLSMFGRLDEDMPCANARTLRATLFKDPEFKKLISDEVIPAWEMVRAVPHITIDLGDGKKVTRTARGNAVMYLCNPDGKVLDAYPGIYTTKDFMPAIHESITALAHADPEAIIAFHKERGHMVRPSWTTMAKGIVEGPTLALLGAPRIAGAVSNETSTDPARAQFLQAARSINDYSLMPSSANDTYRLISGGAPAGADPKVVAQQILDTDSNANMTRTRPVVHLWFASEKGLPSTDEARDAILGTILKVPYKDPYFGLKDVLLPGTPN